MSEEKTDKIEFMKSYIKYHRENFDGIMGKHRIGK